MSYIITTNCMLTGQYRLTIIPENNKINEIQIVVVMIYNFSSD